MIRKPSVLKNERGQMAVFIALTFQIFFVLFAMVVNVGLIAYQKINLQNSVDLAAYYAAQRQAEILNAIAHENYQIRQAYKLLAWRYRVLGMAGYENHPAGPPKPTAVEADELWDPKYPEWTPDKALIPVACIAHKEWPARQTDNLCKAVDSPIKYFPVFPVIIDLFGFNTRVRNQSIRSLDSIAISCKRGGVENWNFTALIWWAFRYEASIHRNTIMWLARSMQNAQDFVDLNGESTLEGVKKTLTNNLTKPNQTGMGNVEMLNSLGLTQWTTWLRDIPISIDLQYVDMSGGTKDCQRKGRSVREFEVSRLKDSSQREILEQLYQAVSGEPRGRNGEPSPERTSLGFEKNPWYMAYVGVKARANVISIFHPFGTGSTTQIEARSFAQPFGGRIGPWYGRTWAPGAPYSNPNDPVDPLAPYRDEQDKPAPNTVTLAAQQERFYPNYSRFPGDKLGLKSKMALNTLIPILPGRVDRGKVFSLSQYQDLIARDPGNDGLAWTPEAKTPPPVRDYEVAAIAPNIFDMTYYSIDTDFLNNYYTPLKKRLEKTGESLIMRRDLGAREGVGAQFEKFGIADQIATVKKVLQPPGWYYYYVQAPAHLLTGWVNQNLYDYANFPTQFFGKCLETPAEKAPVPGNCSVGGRVGYSVRLISKSYLVSESHMLGGSGASVGAILNPPTEGF